MGEHSQLYISYMQSDAWRSIRCEVLARDGHKCSCCGSDVKLCVHHRTYDRLGDERLADLVCLCEVCHKRTHGEVIVER